jgi:Xaa-Pro aminopeptidase
LCATQVLLLSGYWPVVGTALAVATCEGKIVILAPEDEKELAEEGWADTVDTFRPGSLDVLTGAVQAVCVLLARMARGLGINGGLVGYESGAAFEPASYAALHLYGADMVAILRQAFPSVSLVPADAMLAQLRALKTSHEVQAIRRACRIAQRAFLQGANQLRAGLREPEAAALFRAPLSTIGIDSKDIARADGFTFCMSGAYSAAAHGAYVEPAIYIDGYGGLRHCDVVAITENGVEVLTPFQLDPEQLIFDDPREAAIGMPMDRDAGA